MLYYYNKRQGKEGTFHMTRKISFSKVSGLGVLAGLLGYFFHATMLSGGSAIPLIAFSVLMALLFWLTAATLEKKARYEEVFRPMRSDFVLSLLGALALGAGCVLRFQEAGRFYRMICVLGLVGAAGILCAGVLRQKKSAPPVMFYVPAILYEVCELFYDFRRWMHDPAILDYCFCLFALICFMIATYHAASFSFDRGARRRLCFYSLCGVFFGAAAMAGQEVSGMLLYGAGACICLAFSMQALGNGK